MENPRASWRGDPPSSWREGIVAIVAVGFEVCPGQRERREPVPFHGEPVGLELVSGVAGDTSLGSVGRPVELPTVGVLMALLAFVWLAAGVCLGKRSRFARVTVVASDPFVGFAQVEPRARVLLGGELQPFFPKAHVFGPVARATAGPVGHRNQLGHSVDEARTVRRLVAVQALPWGGLSTNTQGLQRTQTALCMTFPAGHVSVAPDQRQVLLVAQ